MHALIYYRAVLYMVGGYKVLLPGEKIALGVTVILAFSVFMLAIAERMPETSESIPLIGNVFCIQCTSVGYI